MLCRCVLILDTAVTVDRVSGPIGLTINKLALSSYLLLFKHLYGKKMHLILCYKFTSFVCFYYFIEVQYNTVIQNRKRLVVLLRFRDSFSLKKAKIKKRKIPDLIYLSVHPVDSV